MAKYWVGVTSDWHDANNWATTSGGAGGAGVPTASDDVYFNSNGQDLVSAATSIVCNNFTLESNSSHIFLMLYQGGIINGDFIQHEGYFAPLGGGGYVLEFKGNWLYDGGTFSVGTGIGVDPTCLFSGINKTFVNNNLAAASFQNFSVTGTYEFSGTRLSVATIFQGLDISGVMTIKGVAQNINRIDLKGGPFTLSGTIDGGGRFFYWYKDNSIMPISGTIKCRYFRFYIAGSDNKPLNADLNVDGWSNINQDWAYEGVEPWIDTNNGDVSCIVLPSVSGSIGLYDEEYTIENVSTNDSPYTSVDITKVKIHLVGKLVAGTGGIATLVMIKGYLWDGVVWQDGGNAIITGTSYSDRTCSTSLHIPIDTLSKLNTLKLKLEVGDVIDGGLDKGYVVITHAYVEVEGTAYYNQLVILNARSYDIPCEVEIEYNNDGQIFRLDSNARHYFNKLTIHCDSADVDTAEFDCATKNAEMWCNGKFDIYENAFPSAVFTLKLGNGVHVFRQTIDFYFSYSSGSATQLVVDPGEGTIVLWPKGRQI